jgi:glycosyltransferase involved in cell wall biosynthesis
MITAIITTYCRAPLLKRAVNSVLNQTFSDFQLCVYDNASTDETEKIMLEFAKKDSRIKYHRHSENIGMMANYQYALDRITTPYFNLLSDDDFVFAHFFETALSNFREFPEAAFCACAILQLFENGDLFSDPLSFWNREGIYLAQEGMLHMIETQKFPIPTGILFKTKLVENIKPDLTKEIQLFWDPNYLIQIAARHPIVIIKKHCGVYLIHPNAFANSVISNVLNDLSNIEIYLRATYETLQRIKENGFLAKTNKFKAGFYFKKYVTETTTMFIRAFIQVGKYGGAHFTAKIFYKYFGGSFFVFYFHFIAAIFKLFDTCRFLMARQKNKEKDHYIISSEELKKHQEYAVNLLNDMHL